MNRVLLGTFPAPTLERSRIGQAPLLGAPILNRALYKVGCHAVSDYAIETFPKAGTNFGQRSGFLWASPTSPLSAMSDGLTLQIRRSTA